MKPIYNIEKRKQPKKKSNSPSTNLIIKKKCNESTISPSHAFLRGYPPYLNDYVNPTESFFKNIPDTKKKLKESDSDIDFLLSSSPSIKDGNNNNVGISKHTNNIEYLSNENRKYNIAYDIKDPTKHTTTSVNVSEALNEDRKYSVACDIKEPVKYTTTPVNISQVLKEKEDTLKDIIYNLPNYFYELKYEYTTYKNKYEKAVSDLSMKEKLCEEFCRKIEELVEESNKKSENILQLMNENEKLKNDQIFLDTIKNEKERLMEIFKKDTEEKNKEIEKLIEERGSLKCENSRLRMEKEMIERETKENVRNFMKLQTEKNVLKIEIENLKVFVKDTFEKHLRTDIFTEIERIEKDNRKLIFFQNFTETIKGGIFQMKQNVIKIEREADTYKGWISNMIVDQSRYEKLIFEYKRQMNEVAKIFDVNIKGTIENIKKEIKKVESDTKALKKTVTVENIQKEFMKIIDRQKSEFEVQKQQYEKKIKDLNEKIEEQQDIWNVFE